MIKTYFFIAAKKLLFVCAFLFVAAMFFANDVLTKSAYDRLGKAQEIQQFFPVCEGAVCRAMNFLSPINLINISLWGDKADSDSALFSFFTLLLILLAFMASAGRECALIKCLFVIFFVGFLSSYFFSVKSAHLLLSFNGFFYSSAAYLIHASIANRGVVFGLFGLVFWLIPNIYQVVFFEALYI